MATTSNSDTVNNDTKNADASNISLVSLNNDVNIQNNITLCNVLQQQKQILLDLLLIKLLKLLMLMVMCFNNYYYNW